MAKSKFTHDVVATVGTYKEGETEKKRYLKVGAAFTDEDGEISIKLDAVPVTPEWSGWLKLYKPRPQEPSRPETKAAPKLPTPPQAEDDDIPF